MINFPLPFRPMLLKSFTLRDSLITFPEPLVAFKLVQPAHNANSTASAQSLLMVGSSL
jgi:hypothetical protein